ncbi:hypothetical protein ACQP1W_29070 [Spirillospora sp. CA-255316]
MTTSDPLTGKRRPAAPTITGDADSAAIIGTASLPWADPSCHADAAHELRTLERRD